MRVALGVVALLALGACTNLFFYPDQKVYFEPGRFGIAHEEVRFTSTDGTRLHAWLLPATGRAKATILFLHGNAQNISAHIASVAWLPSQGYNVFLLDYRGYGESQGVPQLAGVFADIEAAADYVAGRDDLHAVPLVIFGQSLGGALAITAAAKLKSKIAIAAVISDSAFSSYRTIAREKMGELWFTWALQWPLSFAFADGLSPRRYVGELSPTPLLLIHGAADITIPSAHAVALYDAARPPKELWLLPGIRHIEAFSKPEYRERLLAWLTTTLSPPADRRASP